MGRVWLAFMEMTIKRIFAHKPQETTSPKETFKKDQKLCANPAVPVNSITPSSGKDKSPEPIEETQNLIPQKVSAVQTPLTSEVQLGEQDGHQSEDQTISHLRPDSPTSSEDSNYFSCGDFAISSDEENLMGNDRNEVFAVQTQPASKIQSGGQDANQSEEAPIHNPRSASPTSSEDSSDSSVDPCEQQDLLTHRMERLGQKGQDFSQEDSPTTGQSEIPALQTPPSSEILREQEPNESEQGTTHNPRSASPTSSEDSSDSLCKEQDLLTHRMESLQQRGQDCLEEGKGGDMTFDPRKDEHVTSSLYNESESRPVYNMKRSVWRRICSSVSSVGPSFRKWVRNFWSHVCPCCDSCWES